MRFDRNRRGSAVGGLQWCAVQLLYAPRCTGIPGIGVVCVLINCKLAKKRRDPWRKNCPCARLYHTRRTPPLPPHRYTVTETCAPRRTVILSAQWRKSSHRRMTWIPTCALLLLLILLLYIQHGNVYVAYVILSPGRIPRFPGWALPKGKRAECR